MKQALETLKKNWVVIVIVLIVLGLSAGFLAGFRIAPGFTLVRNGTLVMHHLPEGTAVYTDALHRTYAKKGSVRIPLIPGEHTVIVDTPGMQPWNELFSVKNATSTELSPVRVPVRVDPKRLSGIEAGKGQQIIWGTTLPTKEKSLLAFNGCIAIYSRGNDVIAEASSTPACTSPSFLCVDEECAPTVIYTVAEPLHSVLLLPGRQDTLAIASGALFYAIEIDPRAPQFFSPLARGSGYIYAGSWSDTALVVTDNAQKTLVIEMPE